MEEPVTPAHKSPLQRLLALYAYGYMFSGLILPLPLLAHHGMPDGDHLLLAGALALVAMASDRLTIDFHFAGREILVGPDVVAWVLAALFLPPAFAMTVALGSIPSAWGSAPRAIALNAGALATSLGIASWAVSHVLPAPGAEQYLLAGLLASVAFEVVYVVQGLAYLESRERGAAAEHFRESAEVTGFELTLPTVAAAVVGPFVSRPLLAAAVLAAYQAITFLGLRVMKSEQTHKQRSSYLRDAFSRFVPASVVDSLTDEDAELTLGGEEREITVLFCDVRNFTHWSERLAPQQIITELNELMAELTESVFSTEGTLDKYTGDGLMAFWGAPLRQADHADRACEAALTMLRRVEELNERRHAAGQWPLQIGVGVHTGRAVVGNLGHVERMNYTAIGDAVNVAARLEAATKDDGLGAIISGDTFASLALDSALGPLEPMGEIHVKGRTEPIDAYVLAFGAPPPGGSAVDELVLEEDDIDLDPPAEDLAA